MDNMPIVIPTEKLKEPVAKPDELIPIGTKVFVRRRVEFDYDYAATGWRNAKRFYKTKRANTEGYVVGATWRRLGSKSYYEEGGYNFQPKGSVFVYLVRVGLMHRELDVLADDLEVIE